MNLQDHKLLLSFLETHEAMVAHFCNAKDGKFDPVKASITAYLEEAIADEELRFKLTQDEAMRDKMIAWHKATSELFKC
jgi:hypothetical protein